MLGTQRIVSTLAAMTDNQIDDPAEEAPILGSWKRMYVTVLVAHVILILFFYLFSTAYA